MTETLEVVEPRDEEPLGLAPEVLDGALLGTELSPDEVAMVAGLVRKAKDQGLALTGPGGLLKSLTKTVLETALEEELSEHLGYDKHDPVGRNLGNSRNGYRSKTVVTDACGEAEIAVPRDREGSFEPQIVGKRQRWLTDLDQQDRRGDDRLVEPAVGEGLCGGVHRRDRRTWSETDRSATSPTTPRSGSTWTATRTSSGSGPAPVAGSRRSSGWPC